ncbi:MAG: SBBP repeat-containing protein [Bacteroidota bacterium]
MKKNFLLLAFLILNQKQTTAQPIGWYWANSGASNYDTYGNGTTTDVFGNVYVTGGYSGTTFTLGSTTYTGSGDMYLVKYDPSGNILWVKTSSGTQGSSCIGNGMATDTNGNIFVTGAFTGTSLVFGTYTLTSSPIYNDLFIVKFDAGGSVLWAKSAGGTDSDVGRSVSIDSNGNAFVTGYTRSPMLAIGAYSLSNANSGQNVLIAKYDPNGTVLWAKSVGGTNAAFWGQGTSISADVNGNTLVGGFFLNSSITFGTYTLTNAGSHDLFIVKFDPNGTVLWAKSAGGTMGDISAAISSDANGNAFLTGTFQSASIVFGTYTLTNASPPNPTIFVAKYDASGNILWAKAPGFGEGNGICANFNQGVFVTGYYTNTSMVFGTSTLTNNGGDDVFVLEYDFLGNELSSVSAGGSLNDHGVSIFPDGSGHVFVTGTFNSPSAMFGATSLNNTNSNNSDVFIGKLGLCNGVPLSPTDITPPENKNFCEVSSTTLSVTGTGVINWYSSATSTLILASGYSLITPSLNLGNYIYYAEAKTCTYSASRTAITVTVDACLGFGDLKGPGSKLLVYPNPCEAKLFVNNGEVTIDKLSIVNAAGEEFLQKNNHATSQSIDVSVLPTGIYFLLVENEKGLSVVKIIKER